VLLRQAKADLKLVWRDRWRLGDGTLPVTATPLPQTST
jgi:hypothetical protein